MRILLVTTSYPRVPGDAVGAFIALLAEGLANLGHEVTVLTPAAIGAEPEERRGSLRIIRVGRPGLAHSPGGILPALTERPWLVARIPRMIRDLDRKARELAPHFDVVHGHWLYPSGWVAVRAAEAAGRPSFVTGHGADLNLASRIPPLRWWARRVGRRATRTLAVSQAMYDVALSIGIPKDRLEVLPLGVPPSEIGKDPDPFVEAFKGVDAVRLVTVGSLVRRKGMDVLIRALSRCSTLERITLVVVGDGPDRNRLMRLAENLGVRSRVAFVGGVAPIAVHRWLAAADIFVLASRSEGLGLAYVEAMQAGCAVIATDIPGPRELLDEGRTGLLVPRENSQRLAAAIDQLVGDPALRSRFGASAAAAVVAEGRTLGAALDRHQKLYLRFTTTSEDSQP